MSHSHTFLSRRAFARGIFGASTAVLGLALTGRAMAAPRDPNAAIGDQAEWAQKFEGDSKLGVQRSTVPVLSLQTVSATELAIRQYQEIAAQGGWQAMPAGQNLRLGGKGNLIIALRRRLMITGDMDAQAGLSPVFDSYVEAAVKRFQLRHGVTPNGVVGEQTIAAMNVPASVRQQQLETNLIRLRSFSGNLGTRYVAANIPAAVIETVENGVVFSHHVAGVGKIDRQSPIMQTKAIEVNFNPFWTVPASIIRKDLIPKMQADSNYLNDNHIRMINKAGAEVPSASINWNSLEATNYRFREDPSSENSLGVVRININNPYGVYMHDTPAKGIFGDDYRFVSSGCMRLQNVRDYVAWLLKESPGWDRAKIDEAITSGQRIDAKITPPVPVYWVYITAWASPDGLVQFREDIYKRDGFGPGPVASAVPVQAGEPLQPQQVPTQASRRQPLGQVLEPMQDEQ